MTQADDLTVTEWTESRNWTESTETYEAKRSEKASFFGVPTPRGSLRSI